MNYFIEFTEKLSLEDHYQMIKIERMADEAKPSTVNEKRKSLTPQMSAKSQSPTPASPQFLASKKAEGSGSPRRRLSQSRSPTPSNPQSASAATVNSRSTSPTPAASTKSKCWLEMRDNRTMYFTIIGIDYNSI